MDATLETAIVAGVVLVALAILIRSLRRGLGSTCSNCHCGTSHPPKVARTGRRRALVTLQIGETSSLSTPGAPDGEKTRVTIDPDGGAG